MNVLLRVAEEQNTRAMIDELMAETQAEFSEKSAEERAFILIKGYFDVVEHICFKGNGMSDKLSDKFNDWLWDPRDHEAKMRAFDRVIEIDNEICRAYGIERGRSGPAPVAETDMPDLDRLKRLLASNQE